MSYGESVAVVAVANTTSGALPAFLTSLRAATAEPLDIVVAHHGGPDLAGDLAADVRVVETGDVGYGRAANLGVRETTAEFVVVADPDVVWEAGSLDQLL
ncbi:MAG: glycosyltransferase family 2 protein, partial [Jatrophihabitantaceae bacterium]